jgi:HAD superfamily hydrolase (TIGR01509 family)
MPSPKAVIFDMDGVLVDTEPVYIGINRALFAKLGVNMSMEKMLTYVGISANRFWKEVRDDYHLPHSVSKLIALEKQRQVSYFTATPSIPEVPGARMLLSELTRNGVSLAIASSSSPEIIGAILTKTGLCSFFPVCISGQDIARGKPAPDIFLLAAEKMGMQAKDCLVIEDSPHGIAGAKEAGMVCVGYSNPHSGNQNLSAADLIIRDFKLENRKKILSMVVAEG